MSSFAVQPANTSARASAQLRSRLLFGGIGVIGIRFDMEVIAMRDRIVLRSQHEPEDPAVVDRALYREQQLVVVLVVLRDDGLASAFVDERDHVHRDPEGLTG